MAATLTPGAPKTKLGKAAVELDERFIVAGWLRRTMHKVYPDHWSFLLGEIALYSFIVLLLSGTYLTFFFDASIVVHLLRIFFTGAFRRPRETNWLIGCVLLLLAIGEGLTGYSLPDDLLSGTGLRIMSAIVLTIPVLGTWVHWALFGGEYVGELIVGRFYIIHVLLIPGVLLALIGLHLLILVKQKHTQFPGAGRTEHNVVGVRMFPTFAAKSGGLFFVVFAAIALLAGLAQINPVWLWGPYNPAQVSAASQPDWYVMFLDGSTRLFPAWDIHLPGN